MKTETSHVIIKGTKHGLTITLLPGPLSDLLSELSERLQRTAAAHGGRGQADRLLPPAGPDDLVVVEERLSRERPSRLWHGHGESPGRTSTGAERAYRSVGPSEIRV